MRPVSCRGCDVQVANISGPLRELRATSQISELQSTRSSEKIWLKTIENVMRLARQSPQQSVAVRSTIFSLRRRLHGDSIVETPHPMVFRRACEVDEVLGDGGNVRVVEFEGIS